MPGQVTVSFDTSEDILAAYKEQFSLYSSVAQLVEHPAVNRRVVGSSPT